MTDESIEPEGGFDKQLSGVIKNIVKDMFEDLLKSKGINKHQVAGEDKPQLVTAGVSRVKTKKGSLNGRSEPERVFN